jgi:hypothetical protein
MNCRGRNRCGRSARAAHAASSRQTGSEQRWPHTNSHHSIFCASVGTAASVLACSSWEGSAALLAVTPTSPIRAETAPNAQIRKLCAAPRFQTFIFSPPLTSLELRWLLGSSTGSTKLHASTIERRLKSQDSCRGKITEATSPLQLVVWNDPIASGDEPSRKKISLNAINQNLRHAALAKTNRPFVACP